MSNKIHTIQSSDKVVLVRQINTLLELGGELMDGGYQVINNDDGVVYSQVIVFKKNLVVKFYQDGQLRFVENKNEDEKRDGLSIGWCENRQKYYEVTFKDGEPIKLINEWNEDGSVKE